MICHLRDLSFPHTRISQGPTCWSAIPTETCISLLTRSAIARQVVAVSLREQFAYFSSRCDRIITSTVCLHEELHQHGSKDLRGDIMRLTFQGTVLCVGEGVCNLCWLLGTSVQENWKVAPRPSLFFHIAFTKRYTAKQCEVKQSPVSSV